MKKSSPKIKQFHCSHCGALNLVPLSGSAWRERVREFLLPFTASITPKATGELVELGKRLGMWTSTPAGNAKLFQLAEEHLIQRQGHGWWILTDTGMDLLLTSGISIAQPVIDACAELEERPDPDRPAGWYQPTKADLDILKIVRASPEPINDRMVFRLGHAGGYEWAVKWSQGRRLIKLLIANGLLVRPKYGLLALTEAGKKQLPGDLPSVDRTPGVND